MGGGVDTMLSKPRCSEHSSFCEHVPKKQCLETPSKTRKQHQCVDHHNHANRDQNQDQDHQNHDQLPEEQWLCLQQKKTPFNITSCLDGQTLQTFYDNKSYVRVKDILQNVSPTIDYLLSTTQLMHGMCATKTQCKMLRKQFGVHALFYNTRLYRFWHLKDSPVHSEIAQICLNQYYDHRACVAREELLQNPYPLIHYLNDTKQIDKIEMISVVVLHMNGQTETINLDNRFSTVNDLKQHIEQKYGHDPDAQLYIRLEKEKTPSGTIPKTNNGDIHTHTDEPLKNTKEGILSNDVVLSHHHHVQLIVEHGQWLKWSWCSPSTTTWKTTDPDLNRGFTIQRRQATCDHAHIVHYWTYIQQAMHPVDKAREPYVISVVAHCLQHQYDALFCQMQQNEAVFELVGRNGLQLHDHPFWKVYFGDDHCDDDDGHEEDEDHTKIILPWGTTLTMVYDPYHNTLNMWKDEQHLSSVHIVKSCGPFYWRCATPCGTVFRATIVKTPDGCKCS